MFFRFPHYPKKEKKTAVVFALDVDIDRKIQLLADINNCEKNEIYKVLVTEAIEEYERKYGPIIRRIQPILLKAKKPNDEPNGPYMKDPKSVSKKVNSYESRAINDVETKLKKWARDYDACITCGETERKHMGHGKCTKCYFIKDESNNQKEKISSANPIQVKLRTAFCSNPECPDPDTPHYIVSMSAGEGNYKDE